MRVTAIILGAHRPRLAWMPLLLAAPLLFAAAPAVETPVAQSHVDADGVAHLPPMSVPASRFLSPEARRKFIALFSAPKPAAAAGPPDPARMRAEDEAKNAPLVARAQVLYPVDMESRVIGGVRTLVVTPKSGVAAKNRTRVLINLHGGGFIWGEGNGAKTESIPIAGLGRITVIAVAYRLAPENRFPAASEDVAAVYRQLLKEYRPENIGLYGCSAGGILAAESVAWFQKQGLPMPGAIGTFCGSLAPLGGDSSHLAAPLVGERASADADSDTLGMPYFRGASIKDPLVLPINSAAVLARFPPTLLLAGSRDFTVSSLFRSQAALTQAGVVAELHVWDGMWHAFLMDPDLPESQQAFHVIVDFFDRHLGARAAPAPDRATGAQ
jgi:epsilon-lactone hydrolase